MKNKTTAQRLKIALTNCGYRPQDLADKSGVSKSSISQYISGRHAPSSISAKKMSKVLNVNPLWLMGFDIATENLENQEEMRLNESASYYSKTSLAVTGVIKDHDGFTCVELKNQHKDFDIIHQVGSEVCLEIFDNCLEVLQVFKGDKVFIQKNNIYMEDGGVYVVKIATFDFSVFKRVYWQGDQVILCPLTFYHDPLIESVDNIEILGKCVGIYKNI